MIACLKGKVFSLTNTFTSLVLIERIHTGSFLFLPGAGNLKPEAMECDECDYRCDLITQLNSHKQIVHKDGEIPFACNLCPQQVFLGH